MFELSRRSLVTGAVALGIGAAGVASVAMPAAAQETTIRAVGGTTLERTRNGQVLTLRLLADTGTAHVTGVEAYGHTVTFVSRHLARTATGRPVVIHASGATWDAQRRAYTVGASVAEIRLHRFDWQPPSGTPAVAITITLDGSTVEAWPIIIGWSGPDHDAQREFAPAAVTSIRRGADYLETLIGGDGGMQVIHPTWPGDPQTDPQANADLAQLYTGMHRATGEAVFAERAHRTLEYLLAAQRVDGGFGFPWPFGADSAHYKFAGHYPDDPEHRTHPRGEPMAIITISSGLAFLDAYDHFGDPRYLDAVGRIVDYLLHSERGLQWLDAERTRASIPYCTTEPIDDAGHTSAEIYNIDGSSLSVISAYLQRRPNAGADRMGDAVATNLASLVEPDGSIVYGVANLGKPTGYGAAVARGLFDWARHRSRPDWNAAGSLIMGWAMQTDQPFRLAIEPLMTPMGAIDNTAHVQLNIDARVASQRPDGSWTGGTNTRTDVGNPKHMVLLLNQMSYRTPS
ncbi:hypothetical protein [Microlunatus sp. Y2014]|uniref:hypothetical protein n=1 Tax=Microlunatus sp. Y2014 TaxID=3418488 RepID=UPI003DA6D465